MTGVVLVHGFSSSFEQDWRRTGFVDLLTDAGFRVLPFDFPGHGTADKPHDPAAYDDLAGSIAAALPDEPVDAVGYSIGGATLLRLAMREPERIRRLVLVGVGESVFRPRTDNARLADALECGLPDAADEQLRRFVGLATADENDPLALAAFVRRPGPPMTDEELRAVRCPTLVALGEHDFAGPGDRLVAALPDGRELVVPGGDHFGTVRSPVFRSVVLDFLRAPV